MRIIAILRVALRALRRNLMRTLLTMLGIIIGVAAVIAMVSIGNGAKAQIEKQVAGLGQNVVRVMSGNLRRGGFSMGFGSSGTLTKEDMLAIQREVSGVVAVSPEVRASAQVAVGNQNLQTSILGVSAEYPDIRSWPLENGSSFSEQDVRSSAKVAIIGKTTAKQLFGEEDPIGQIIRIKNAPFTVVGLLTAKGMSAMGSDQDDVLLVPWTSAMTRLTGGTTMRLITVQAASSEQMAEVQQQIGELLRQRHRIPADGDNDFTVSTQTEITDAFTATSKTMTILLAAIASVSLLVGGIGIMNIMLVSVTERTREIGIRMAVGAKGRDILMQFLTEAIALSVIGGLLGIALGLAASRVIAQKMNWPVLTPTDAIMMAFVFSAAVGIFFGFYPARKASRLDPIDALRYE
jgi:putative ABC transport system permease protein